MGLKVNFKNSQLLWPFHYRDFNLLLTGECFYRSAIWMTSLVFGILATRIKGDSTFYVGLIGFGFNIPMLFLMPVTGVLADRIVRLKILKWVQVIFMVPALVMALVLLEGLPNYWLMLAMVLLFGVGFAVGNPALLSIVHDIVLEPKVLGGALSIFISSSRIFQFVGYGLGGILFAVFGAGFCFWLSIGTYLITLFILFFVRTRVKIEHPDKPNFLQDVKEGFLFVKSFFPVWVVIALVILNGFIVWPYIFQMPIVNKYYLGGTPATLGLLLALGGAGGAIGGLIVAFRKNTRHLTHLIIISSGVISVSLLLLTFCRQVSVAAPLMFTLDFGLSMLMIVSNVFVQHLTPNEKRGRVMSIFAMGNIGMIPLGSLVFYGGLGEWLGPMWMFFIGGVIFLVAIALFIVVLPQIRQEAMPIFVQKGLIEADASPTQI